MLKRITVISAVLLLIAGCSEELTQPEFSEIELVTSADVIPGWPGIFPTEYALIDVGSSSCEAQYMDAHGSNFGIGSGDGTVDIMVTANKKWIHATCKFIDLSVVYEANAEVGAIDNCTLVMEDGTEYKGGTGHVTSAANIKGGDDDLGTGGNTTIQCKFANTGGDPGGGIPT